MATELMAVMDAMVKTYETSDKNLGKECERVMELLYVQQDTLKKEVEKYCKERGVDLDAVKA